MHCETHARAAKVAEAMGQQTAASIKAAAASPSGAAAPTPPAPSQVYKPPSPSQPAMPQPSAQVRNHQIDNRHLRVFLEKFSR